jgi:hypothetical protein
VLEKELCFALFGDACEGKRTAEDVARTTCINSRVFVMERDRHSVQAGLVAISVWLVS